jgi:hypothetical protein
MYDQTCLDNTKKAWLDIEETLQTNPTGDQALACLKRIQHLLTQCIQKDFSNKSPHFSQVELDK